MRRIRTACAVLMCVLLASFCMAETPMPADVDVNEMEAVELMRIDHRLFELGYRDSAANGVADEVMEAAIRNFQTANELPVTGQPDVYTVELLMSEAAISEKDYLAGISSAYNNSPALTLGSAGEDVLDLQRRLAEYGYFDGTQDGIYGESTVNAIYRFQIANGLPETGIADGSTRMRLYEGQPVEYDTFIESCCAGVGESGTNVRRIQRRLKKMGYYTGKCVGRFGSGTRQAVLLFQSLNGLDATGNADAVTCRLLFSGIASTFSDTYTILRGSESDDVAAICMLLNQLGYRPGEVFDLKTEIAVLQFQIANGLDATGAVDSATYSLLASMSAVAYEDVDWKNEPLRIHGNTLRQMYSTAMATVGQKTALDGSFEYVQYIALKCGIALMESEQLTMTAVSEDVFPQAGMIVRFDDTYGIAVEDGGMISMENDGYIVILYPERTQEKPLYVWSTVES